MNTDRALLTADPGTRGGAGRFAEIAVGWDQREGCTGGISLVMGAADAGPGGAARARTERANEGTGLVGCGGLKGRGRVLLRAVDGPRPEGPASALTGGVVPPAP
ncbi:hypothetical protein GCM10010206_60790 [Streptomyces cinerochromogenes]|nr:hypothetical protein GCM10010206_60790 [Streptomyces cinerochromogenes]